MHYLQTILLIQLLTDSVAKIRSAFKIDAAAGEPPFLPSIEIWDTLNLAKACLDSITETKPTGTPIISAGLT